MEAFLKSLDPRVRAGTAFAVALLAATSAWGVVRSSVSGPWALAVVLGMVAVAAFQMQGQVWPDKMPWKPLEDAIDKWSKRRATITKTTMGRIVWKIMRALAGAAATWYLCEPLATPVRFAACVGFGASFGFFGASAAMWGGFVAVCLAAAVAAHGLGVNFGSPQQRAQFLETWSGGGLKLSWLWALGFAATPGLWVVVAACVSSARRSIVEGMAKKNRDAADRKRIEDRRKRLDARRMTASEDVVGAAMKQLEETKERVRAAARRSGSGGDDHGGGEHSPRGEDVLRKANMEDALSQYAAQVALILRSERSGVDMESQGRRAFDRVVLAMTDDMVARLRSADSQAMKDLYAYYERVCEAEAGAAGGDGALVSTRVERREDEYIEQSGDGSDEAHQDEGYGSIGIARGVDAVDEDDDDGDVLDSPRPSRGRLLMPDDLLPVSTAPVEVSVGADGAPVGGGLLPVDEEEEDAVEGHGGTGVAPQGATLAGDGYEAETLVPDEDFQGLPATAPVEGAHEEPPEHEDLHHPDEHHHDGIGGDAALGIDPEREAEEPHEELEPDLEPEASHAEPIGGDEAAGHVDAGLVEAAGSDHGGIEPSIHEEPASMTIAEEGVASATAFTQDEKRSAAAMILSNQVDRSFVEKYHETFRTVADAAAALSVPEAVFGSGWPGYAAKADALAAEKVVRGLLEDGAEDAVLRDALEELVAHSPQGWSVDTGLASDIAGEIARRAEERRLEEEQKRKAEEERLALIERERIAEEEKQAREKAEREERELRERQEEEERRLQREEEERQENERVRLAELEAKRMSVAIKLLANQHDDDTVAAATELFPDRAALAAALSLDEAIVDTPFERFVVVRDARMRYVELITAIGAEDVNAVEALVRSPESFVGYEHPEMTVETATKWAEGIRARERVRGIVETARPDIATSGLATRKLFLAKRLKLSTETTALIDKDLIEAFEVVRTTREFLQMASRNKMLPAGTEAMLADAETRLGDIARAIVAEPKAAEYVRAFLPDAQRVADKDPWDMLVEIAAGERSSIPAAEAADEPQAEAEREPYEAPVETAELLEEAVEESGRIRAHISFEPFKPGPTLEEVQAMDWRNIVAGAKATEPFDPAKIARRVSMSMSEFMSSPGERITVDGNFIHIPVDGPRGQVGKILVEVIPTGMPVWYLADTQQVVMKNSSDGKIQFVESSRFLSGVDGAVEKPNGHPDTPIGMIILSSLISPEGLISFRPLMEDQVVKRGLGNSLLIASVTDNEGIKRFYGSVRDAAVA